MEITIKRAILHILDNNASIPVISNRELELENSKISDFFKKHIEKLYNDAATKNGTFSNNKDNQVLNQVMILAENEDGFIEASIAISNELFKLMTKHIDIPPADLVFCIADVENRRYLAILKMNYRECYTHYVENDGDGLINQLIMHKTILPSESHRLEEGALIYLDDYTIRLLEAPCEIDGEKRLYFSELFLECKTDISKKDTLKIINKVAQDISEKYYDGSFTKVTEVKSAIYEISGEDGNLEIDRLAQKVFRNSKEIQDEYKEGVFKSGIPETVTLDAIYVEKKVMTQKIKTDTGIEINFPSTMYNDKDMMEFINNPDGTISILIKNINKITGK